MKLKIKYFGMLAEFTNCEEETIDFTKSTVSDLIDELNDLHPELNTINFQVAIDKKIVDKNSLITEAEIAMLPPFSGG